MATKIHKVEATAKEKRQARAFLRARNVSSKQIDPETFATTAKAMRLTFGDLYDRITQRAAAMEGARA